MIPPGAGLTSIRLCELDLSDRRPTTTFSDQTAAPVGAAQSWSTNTYDALGRTIRTVAADGASATSYSYLANTVTVTDPAGNAKIYTMDGLGQLVTVAEPQGLITSYAYDVLGHLTVVSMPRTSGQVTYTQTRAFNYAVGMNVGALLLSATNPETGTVTYTYNSDNTLASKHDAKGQVFTYAYDGYKRVGTVSVGGALLRSYIYDSNTLDATYSQYALGRLAAVQNASNAYGLQFTEMYSYAASGLAVGKRLQVNQVVSYTSGGISQQGSGQRNWDAAYSYNTEGQVTAVTYPTTYPYTDGLGNPVAASGPSYTYGFDAMSRPVGLTDQSNSTVVNGVSYGPANELLGMTYNGIAEVRSYNSMLQLIGLGSGSYVGMQYVYPAGANNGKVCLQSDLISHEQTQYGYDAWNRLWTATALTISGQPSSSCTPASGTSTWTQSYAYDGYGSLTDKNVALGSAPSLHVAVDPATNRIGGQYDANGNMTAMAGNVSLGYDSENRLSQWINYNAGASARHGYDSQNKRVWVWGGGVDQYGNPSSYQVYFYGLNGKRLSAYQVTMNVPATVGRPAILLDAASSTETYFGSRRLAPMDRLGSVPNPGGSYGHATYYPYGEDKVGNPGGDGWKFATYSRDGGSGLDYADQRYYSSSLGRFMSADPSIASAGVGDPGSWNRYAYVQNDPVDFVDPRGLYEEYPNGCGAPGTDFCIADGGIPPTGTGGGLTCTLDGLLLDCTSALSLYNSGAAQLAPTPPGVSAPVFIPGIGGILGGILSNILIPIVGIVLSPVPTGGWGDMFPTVDQVRQRCTANGAPVVMPSTQVRNKGGKSIEQEYVCPDGSHFTIHTLVDQNGNVIDEHVRPGAPKYGRF